MKNDDIQYKKQQLATIIVHSKQNSNNSNQNNLLHFVRYILSYLFLLFTFFYYFLSFSYKVVTRGSVNYQPSM